MKIFLKFFCYLLALISSIVGCIDAKQRHKRRRWGRYVKFDVNGIGTTERSVVSQSLESNYSVLQETDTEMESFFILFYFNKISSWVKLR